MLKNEFLIMAEQDLQTHANRDQLLNVLECMKEILKDYPAATEINQEKTVEDCFSKMKAHAQKNQKAGCYYFFHKDFMDFVTKYLDLEKRNSTPGIINLEDFL